MQRENVRMVPRLHVGRYSEYRSESAKNRRVTQTTRITQRRV